MNYFIIEPEVAGEFGNNTIYDNYDEIINKEALPVISHLHFVFDGWLGDELLEVTPCFLVTERLRHEIESIGYSGCEFDDVEVTYSDNFLELYPNINMLVFYRLIPQHTVLVGDTISVNQKLYDVMISQKKYLVVSDRFRTLLETLGADKNADYTPIEFE